MEQQELYKLLDLPQEVTSRLTAYGQSRCGAFHTTVYDLMQDMELVLNLHQLIAAQVGEDPDGIKILWEELNIAAQAFDEYHKKDIPVDIFVDTMKFCTRFLEEHRRVHGCYRFEWGWWFPRQLSLREFRLGALEYEFCDNKYVSLHIPSDADLSEQSVRRSLNLFRDFCRKYYPAWEDADIQCESWMLSPALKDVLNSTSHILAFQRLFHVQDTDYESMAVLDWVFPGFNQISDQLPEHTSLQRNMKQYLLNGSKIGWSKGILIKDQGI